MQNYLTVAVIARDKFSTVKKSIQSLAGQLPGGSVVQLFDCGYPEFLLKEICDLAGSNQLPLSLVTTQRFATTNHVWNQFVADANSTYLMGLENDVAINPGCIQNSLECLTKTKSDIVVPIVYENTRMHMGLQHFNPFESKIVELPNGRTQSILDRGRHDGPPMPVPRTVKHLERHCFLMTTSAAQRLGPLDEEMYDRTDHDMSLQSHKMGLTISIADASVVFTQFPDLSIDREFFDYRWNLDRIVQSNSRLISKWKLEGFKTTVDHAHNARKNLDVPVP